MPTWNNIHPVRAVVRKRQSLDSRRYSMPAWSPAFYMPHTDFFHKAGNNREIRPGIWPTPYFCNKSRSAITVASTPRITEASGSILNRGEW